MTDATNPSAKTGDFEARALMLVRKHGNPVGTDYEQGQNDMGHRMVTLARDADAAILSARTHPQPSLSVGLDREVRERLTREVNDPLSSEVSTVFTSDLRSLLALAAPAEGYVLVPVEPTEAMRYDGDRKLANAMHKGGSITDTVLAIYRAMIAACLPAAPTGETGV